MRLDERLHRGRIEVADDDHRHQIGPIPVGVELLQAIVGERANDLRLADGQALGVAGILQQHRQLRVEDPGVGAETRAPLLEDDATLLVDLGRFERHGVRPVLEDQQGPSMTAGLSVGIRSS